MIDTHCHLNFEAFQDDWREVADRAVAAGITKLIVVGTDLETSKRAVALAKEHPNLYASIGIHPHHARSFARENLNFKFQISNQIQNPNELIEKQVAEIAELAKEPRVVAIGEVGLDYHVFKQSKYPEALLEITPELKELQRTLFIEHIKIAANLNKPLIIHSRECKEEVLQILLSISLRENLEASTSGHSRREIRGVFHCFGGSKKYAKRILEAGFYLGFDGDITYVPDRLGVSAVAPLDRLLLETDSPYLTPSPLRGERNEPRNIKLIAEAQAGTARTIRVREVERVTSENAEKLFNF